MICLGLESTAHTFGFSIVNDKGKILSDSRSMFTSEEGGMIPNKVAEFHKANKEAVVQQALDEANLDFNNIDIIAFSQGPGMPLSLAVGKDYAKELAGKYSKPLIPVNHLIGHLEIGKLLTKAKDPVFILATGANTQIIAYESGKYRLFGETLDIGIGNALDKFGRAVNLGFPAGPKIEQLAKKGNYIELPYTVKGMDLAFSGIVTECINKFKKNAKKEDLCFSLQETAFAMLTEVTERALAHTNKREALLIGGVAANQRLSEMLSIMCRERKAKFFAVPLKYSGDQAAMIAWTGILQYESEREHYDKLDISKIDIKPNWRSDEVEVTWI